jgi:hypothetical protein
MKFWIITFSILTIFDNLSAQKVRLSAATGLLLSKIDEATWQQEAAPTSFYQEFQMDRPFLSSLTTFELQVRVTKKTYIGIKARQLTEGAKSKISYDPFNNNNPSFGGYKVSGRQGSLESGLQFSYLAKKKGIFDIELAIMPAIGTPIFIERSVEEIRREIGYVTPQGSFHYSGFIPKKNPFSTYFSQIKQRAMYGSLYGSTTIRVRSIYDWLSFYCIIECGISDSFLSKHILIDTTPLGGRIIKGIMQVGTSIQL